MPKVVVPGEWERIDCSTFNVVVTDLDTLDYDCVLWDSIHYLTQTGHNSPVLARVELLKRRLNIWVARFNDLEPLGNCVIGIVRREHPAEPVAVGGIRLAISDQTALLRRPFVEEGPERAQLQYPVPILWNENSNFHYADSAIPLIKKANDGDYSYRAPPGQLGPTLTELYGRESHDATSRMLLQYCIGVGSEDFQKHLARSSWTSAPGYTALFSDADLYLTQGVICDRSGIWGDSSVAALVGPNKLAMYPDMFEFEGKIGRVEHGVGGPALDGISFVIGNAGYGNFAHWMMNSFLAAYLLKDDIIRSGGRIVCPPMPSFGKESLQLLGLWDHVTEISAPRIRAKQLVYPSHLATHANMYPAANVAAMIADLKRAAEHDPQYHRIETPDFIYLTRQGFPSNRNLTNEGALIEALRKLGFKTVATHDLSFVERVRVFSKAKIIIGQLGAALSHILLLPKDSVFVEITTESWHSNEYWYAAKLLQIWCVRFMVEVKPENFVNRGSFSFDVPVGEIAHVVAALQRDYGTWVDSTLEFERFDQSAGLAGGRF